MGVKRNGIGCARCGKIVRVNDPCLLLDEGLVCAEHAPTWRELIDRAQTSDDPPWQNSLAGFLMDADAHVAAGGAVDGKATVPLTDRLLREELGLPAPPA